MHVAVCQISLHIYTSHSLKDKRRTVASLCERIRQRYPVSVAEVSGQETWQRAVLGIAVVSGEETTAREIVEKAAEFARMNAQDAEVTQVDYDVFDY